MYKNWKLPLACLCLVIFVCVQPSVTDSTISPPYYLISVKTAIYMLPLLQYNLTDLSPFIDNETLLEHYEGRHDEYRQEMNDVLAKWRKEDPSNSLAAEPIFDILKRINEVPERYQEKLKTNLGGFINHALVWGVMSPNENQTERYPTGLLLEEIENSFITYKWFKDLLTARAEEQIGSGYVWLVRNRTGEPGLQLQLINTSNEDSPISMDLDPLLVVDVWEHAYYRKHQFNKRDYLKSWWMLVDWESVEAVDRFFLKQRQNAQAKDEL